MAGRYYERLLGVPADVPAPDYFQLLGVEPDASDEETIVGSIEVVRSPAAQSLIDRVQGRYVATEAATDDPTALSFLESDDVALRFTPVSAFTWDHRASEGSRILRSHGWARPLVTTEPRA